MKPRTSFDFRLTELLVIKLLGPDAYGDKIAETMNKYRKRTCDAAQVHVSLKRLVDQGLIYIDTTVYNGRRGRPKIIYTLTPLGNKELDGSLSCIDALVRDIKLAIPQQQ